MGCTVVKANDNKNQPIKFQHFNSNNLQTQRNQPNFQKKQLTEQNSLYLSPKSDHKKIFANLNLNHQKNPFSINNLKLTTRNQNELTVLNSHLNNNEQSNNVILAIQDNDLKMPAIHQFNYNGINGSRFIGNHIL